MSDQVLFKAHIPSIKMIMASGKEIIFINGKFVTNNEAEIDFLRAEIASGQPHVYEGDPKEITAVPVGEDPLAGLKAKMREDLLAELEASGAVVSTAGTSEVTAAVAKLSGMANSRTIAKAAQGSGS